MTNLIKNATHVHPNDRAIQLLDQQLAEIKADFAHVKEEHDSFLVEIRTLEVLKERLRNNSM